MPQPTTVTLLREKQGLEAMKGEHHDSDDDSSGKI
jgi:hypothetical protein